MNQQGTLKADASGRCSSSQNGRGGLFYVLENEVVAGAIADLIHGGTAPTRAPRE
jgi:hypothetical protein